MYRSSIYVMSYERMRMKVAVEFQSHAPCDLIFLKLFLNVFFASTPLSSQVNNILSCLFWYLDIYDWDDANSLDGILNALDLLTTWVITFFWYHAVENDSSDFRLCCMLRTSLPSFVIRQSASLIVNFWTHFVYHLHVACSSFGVELMEKMK